MITCKTCKGTASVPSPKCNGKGRIKEKLKVIENARNFASGAQGYIDHSKLTAPEVDIIADVNRHIGELREILETNVVAIDTEISCKTKGTNVDSCIDNIERNFRGKARDELDRCVNSQESNLRAREEAKRWLQEFRHINERLTRPADYPESLTLHFGIAMGNREYLTTFPRINVFGVEVQYKVLAPMKQGEVVHLEISCEPQCKENLFTGNVNIDAPQGINSYIASSKAGNFYNYDYLPANDYKLVLNMTGGQEPIRIFSHLFTVRY